MPFARFNRVLVSSLIRQNAHCLSVIRPPNLGDKTQVLVPFLS